MKHMIKRTLLVGAGLATIGVTAASTLGVASAASDTSTTGNSIVDKIAQKFNLNKADVQTVFDEDRTTHQAEKQANAKDRLAQAVKDGKLTQAQADHITTAMTEIQALVAGKQPGQLDTTTRDAIKAKRDALLQWAKDNKLDTSLVGMMGGRGGMMHRGGMGMMGDTDDTAPATTSTN